MADQKTPRSPQAQQPQRSSAAGATGGGAQNAGNGGSSGSAGNAPGASNTPNVSGVSGAGTPSSRMEQRADREREREVSREGSGPTGTGMQRGSAPGSRGSLVGGQQGQQSLLPALLSNPDLMTRAFMANPFSFAQAMSQEMDRLFSTGGVERFSPPVAQTGAGGQTSRTLSQWTPPMEVLQRENELVVRADLPGLKPDDIQIDVEDHVLTISGERQEQTEDRQRGFYRTERSYGSFSRSIALPEGVDEEQVNARFEHGVLEVTVPLPQQRQRGRRIQVQSGTAPATGQQAPRAAQGSAQTAAQGATKSAADPGARTGGRAGVGDATVEMQGSE